MPSPVVNGQFVKGVGGAAVWSAIGAADLPGIVGAPAIPPSNDLNNATSPGWYQARADAPATANKPTATWGCVRTDTLDGWTACRQTYFEGGSFNTYERWTMTGAGGWSAWTKTNFTGGDLAWHYVGNAGEPAFQNGHSNYGVPYGPVRYRKLSNGLVVCDGLMTSNGPSTTVWTFPVGFRPNMQGLGASRQLIFVCASSVAQQDTFRLAENGNLAIQSISVGAWVSLCGVQFYADS
jgi:hypothetical protein